MKNKKAQKNLRHIRVKKSISSNTSTPRLVVFRSNKYLYAQIIDDVSAKTMVAHSDLGAKKNKPANKLESAKEIGKELAKRALKKNLKKVVFDRAGYKYHGRIKSLAVGARESGLEF